MFSGVSVRDLSSHEPSHFILNPFHMCLTQFMNGTRRHLSRGVEFETSSIVLVAVGQFPNAMIRLCASEIFAKHAEQTIVRWTNVLGQNAQ